jgi:hypothetical protein
MPSVGPLDRMDNSAESWEHRAMDHLRLRLTDAASRHPSLLRVLEWFGLHNPGGSANP